MTSFDEDDGSDRSDEQGTKKQNKRAHEQQMKRDQTNENQK